MKKILFTILLSFVAIFAYSQVNYSFRGKANIYSATRGTGVDTAKWVILAVFTDDMSYYASDSLALGDYIYTTSDFGCAALRVDTINSKTGTIFNLDVTDMNNVLTSISGQSFVFTPTPTQGLPTFSQGLPAQIQACIIADLALRIDDALSNVTPDSTIFQTVYRGDTSAQAIRQEIADSNATYATIGTLLQNKFPFASGSKSMTTTLGYLGRETGRVYVDSLAAFRLPSWTTPGRIVSAKNGDEAYNATLNLPDIYVNGAWKNGVVSAGALTLNRVPYSDVNGHLVNSASFIFIPSISRMNIGPTYSNQNGQGIICIFQGSDIAGNGLQFKPASSPTDLNYSGIYRLGSALVMHYNNASTAIQGNRLAINSTATSATSALWVNLLTGGISDGQQIWISGTEARSSSPGGGAGDGTYRGLIRLQPTYNFTGSANENVRGIDYNPTVTSILGIHYGITIGSGLSGFGTRTPTQTVDVNGAIRLRGLLYDINNSAGTDGQILSKTTAGVDWIDAPETGGSFKRINQTAHGFTAPESVFWNGVEYETTTGVYGDTIRCSGVVVEVYSVDSFKLQFNGIYEDDFSLPEGVYYAGDNNLSLTKDTIVIPAMQVENGYSVINPIVEDETSILEGTAFTLETIEGSRLFEFGETLVLHRDSLIGDPLDSLTTETSTTPSNAAKFAINLIDSSGGSKVVTPPASPVAGDWFAVSNSRGELVNTITIDTSTDKLHSAAADHVMAGGVLFARFTYVNSTIGWIESD